ncbi:MULTISPECIES: flagellar hook-associated family protein [unclassified Mesorhizobium]|uniref:flagellar hook-associated family protein n=1 Tax=unclassified Mesorhizobium TaxID=325217 RepID=UPI000FDAEAF3|nr:MULTISPECIES: flagellar hook-associated family protein [unclassified Mesorhizobium]TGQ39529.1 flagellar hook-associated family protein [Mesorhizobium sp. M00.F.Ca.ET.216.01.1.1]TIS57208.1 MAG: flagellar hook-associated family protein [Mesorhizobium sp.]TIS91774.1 MAG: flagellar hook-associated family protein [Mesorhizobium sp.]TJW11612.1 MAG: flagellar hook-associated family protein [Mesorhizobium sp.]TJW42823.1 MAG: flagellar hook-associated family protein [Mesorhizobium sp.]
MKATSVSSAAMSNAMRYSQLRMQRDLVNAQKEASTGTIADVGLALGGRTAQAVTFSRDLDRLNVIIDSNALVTARLSSTQTSLGDLSDVAQDFLSSLTSAASGDSSNSTTQFAGKTALQQMTSILNTSVNGEYLFAGTNTDVKPIDDFTAAGSAAKAAFDASFLAYFSFTPSDPAAANITAAQMDAFITSNVEPQFLGSGWQGTWSNATDQEIVSRIALNETTQTSVSANDDGIRKLAMAAAMVTGLLSSNISQAAKNSVVSRSVSLVGEALGGLAQLQSETGFIEKRVSDASDRMKTQVDLFERHIIDLEGVDPTEAATRVANLTTHIETSFALTARLQQLSLLNYLT